MPSPVPLDDLGRADGVPGLQGVADRLVDQALLLEPVAGPAMKLGNRGRVQGLLQLHPQQVTEQMVVAKPLSLVVQRDGEQIAVLQCLDEFRAAEPGRRRLAFGSGFGFGQRIADTSAESLQERRPQQAISERGRLNGDDLP